jgi:hypothetical protein
LVVCWGEIYELESLEIGLNKSMNTPELKHRLGSPGRRSGLFLRSRNNHYR